MLQLGKSLSLSLSLSSLERATWLMRSFRASKLRKKGEVVYDAKYAGKKGSRKELYGDEEEEEEDEGMGSEESHEEMDDDVDEDGFEDLEEEDEEEEVVEEVKVKKVKKSSSSKSKTSADQDEKAMMKQLKQAASADVDKGRDVKKQLVSIPFLLLQGRDSRVVGCRLSRTTFLSRGSGFKRQLHQPTLFLS